jgi:hypothetical protein
MDKELNISLAKRYSELVSQQISAKYIVLYGSYAKGELVLAPVEFKWRSITLFCSHFLPDPRHQH